MDATTLDRPRPRERKQNIDLALKRQHLHDITALISEIRHFLVRHDAALKETDLRREMRQLEDWLEAERRGPAPAGIISESGMAWLERLRNRLKLSAEETQRLEGEGGNPCTKEQVEKTEAMLKAVRHIDKIIDEAPIGKPH